MESKAKACVYDCNGTFSENEFFKNSLGDCVFSKANDFYNVQQNEWFRQKCSQQLCTGKSRRLQTKNVMSPSI